MTIDYTSLIAARERSAAVAGMRGEKAHLLMDADQNIGNELIILTPNVTNPPLTIPTQNPDRLINLNAASKAGQMVTVFIGASANTKAPGLPSSFMTAVIEFGNGSRFTSLELDIPMGPFQLTNIFGTGIPTTAFIGGALLTVPAGTLRVYARSDATLVTPNSFGTLPIAAGLGVEPPQDQAHPTIVTSFAGYYTRATNSAPTKTLWLGRTRSATRFITVAGINPGVYSIPAFAKTIRILRDPIATTAITFELVDAGLDSVLDTIAIPAGTRSETYKIPGNASFFQFVAGTTDPVPAGTTIQAIFELEI